MTVVIALVSGLVMGLGLCVSQMVNPGKVIAFLDVSGNWDPSLMLVMVGALFVTIITFRLILKCRKPFCADQFNLPQKKGVDLRLITGSALFGVGWGLAGFCPAPAFASLAFGIRESFVFVGAMLSGMLAYKIWAEGRR